MMLKEEFAILRGEAIAATDCNPMDIPCIETSDSERLCKNPVVSVHMITYNHEPYIRQAIEGVMMQKTNFEFELVIGEDASQDKTREICFEYQKKYPDRIRVLWWHENVSKLGGNDQRVMVHCRGELIAFCEGDDYWTDQYKLQKQVALMRDNGAIGCVALTTWLDGSGKRVVSTYARKDFIDWRDVRAHYFHTSTYIFQRDVLEKMRMKYTGIYHWYDTCILFCMASLGKIALLPEDVSVYRITRSGIATSLTGLQHLLLGLEQTMQLVMYGPRISRHVHCSQSYQLLGRLLLFDDKDSIEFVRKHFCVILKFFWLVRIRSNLFSIKSAANTIVFLTRLFRHYLIRAGWAYGVSSGSQPVFY